MARPKKQKAATTRGAGAKKPVDPAPSVPANKPGGSQPSLPASVFKAVGGVGTALLIVGFVWNTNSAAIGAR